MTCSRGLLYKRGEIDAPINFTAMAGGLAVLEVPGKLGTFDCKDGQGQLLTPATALSPSVSFLIHHRKLLCRRTCR